MAEVENAGSAADFGVDPRKDLLVKHPLQNTWTLWYFENDKKKSWAENLRPVTSFSTVEDFWCLYNHIKPASELRLGCDYCLFKQGIRPMWEDDANKYGGRWLISIERRSTNDDELDSMWLEILLCLVGEGFDEVTDEVCGAVINVRPKAYKIAIWTADYKRESSLMEIGRKLKTRLHIQQRDSLSYQTHEATAKNPGPSLKPMFQI